MRYLQFLVIGIVLAVIVGQTASSAIPMWEFLSYEEKMKQLFYILVNMIDHFCKSSEISDCKKSLTLYGISNLMKIENDALDLLDPAQRNAREIIWQAIMKPDFKYPAWKKPIVIVDDKPVIIIKNVTEIKNSTNSGSEQNEIIG